MSQFSSEELKQIYKDKANLVEALKTNEKLLVDLNYKTEKIKVLEAEISLLENRVNKLSELLNDAKK